CVCRLLRCLRSPRQSTTRRERERELQSQHQHQNHNHLHHHQPASGKDNAVKILLLGTAESGKTTIIKQMRILHINGFTDDERREKIPEIYQNIHDSIIQLVLQMEPLGLRFGSLTTERSANYILSLPAEAPDYFNEEYCDHVMTLWNDVGIRACYDRSNEFPLLDSTKYFLDNFERICELEYIPSTEDILHSRKVTTGISKITFRVPIPKSLGGGEQEFRMFDVGGQRGERNKWIQVFDTQVVLFLISCSEFDQNLREDPSQNRLQEALNLFRAVWQNRFLASSGLIVFLNKYDIMERKIRAGKHIVDYFPEFEEFSKRPQQLQSCFDESDWTKMFIKQKMIDITQEQFKRNSRNQSDFSYSERECYYHFTVATDTRCIRDVFSDVQQMILSENMSVSPGLF
ncbi:hypothetical protein KR222_006801, partial [Zaprionus bogoriensis]